MCVCVHTCVCVCRVVDVRTLSIALVLSVYKRIYDVALCSRAKRVLLKVRGHPCACVAVPALHCCMLRMFSAICSAAAAGDVRVRVRLRLRVRRMQSVIFVCKCAGSSSGDPSPPVRGCCTLRTLVSWLACVRSASRLFHSPCNALKRTRTHTNTHTRT